MLNNQYADIFKTWIKHTRLMYDYVLNDFDYIFND